MQQMVVVAIAQESEKLSQVLISLYAIPGSLGTVGCVQSLSCLLRSLAERMPSIFCYKEIQFHVLHPGKKYCPDSQLQMGFIML